MNRTLLVIGIILVVGIIFVIYNNSKNRAAEEARQQQLAMSQYQLSGASAPGSVGLTGTISSVGDLIDSLGNLFKPSDKPSKPSQIGIQDYAYSVAQQEQQCMDAYPGDFAAQARCISAIN